MTTPAINRNSVVHRPGHLIFQNWSNSGGDLPPVTIVNRNVNCGWDSETRPASGTVLKAGRNGWRNCRGWNHSGRRWTYPSNTVHVDINYGTYGTRYKYTDGSFWGITPPAVPAFPNGIINQTEIKALNHLKDQDFNLGQFVAEFHKTAHMVAKGASSIASQVRRWRRGNPPQAWGDVLKWERWWGRGKSFAKNIPASWLEMQYGWSPLLSDIKGLIEELSESDRLPLVHCKGYTKSVGRLPLGANAVFGSSTAELQLLLTQECWVNLYYKVTNESLANASELGLVNPLEIVWECLPYSFVVDWFVPIGSWMSSLTADAGYTFQGGSRSTKTTIRGASGVPSWDHSDPRVKVYGAPPSLEGEDTSFTRTCYEASPVPGLYFKNPLSATHVLNAIALLVQAFR